MEGVLWIILGVMLAWIIVLIALAAFVWWRIQRSDEKKLARRIAKLRFVDKVGLAFDLFRDPRIPPVARIIALGLVVYLAMPLDFVPDFIPMLGYVDDFLIVIIGGGLLLRSIPGYVLEDHIGRYEDEQELGSRRPASARR